MQLSAVIINYNTPNYTLACLNSIYSSPPFVNFEVIVIDNASTTHNPEIFKESFPQIKLIKSAQNLGFAGGNNLGIAQAIGKFILLLNSDAELLPGAIQKAIARIEADETIGALSGKLIYPDGKPQYPAQRFDTISRELREVLRLNKRMPDNERAVYYLGNAFDHQSEVFCDWVWGTFMLIRKSVINQMPEKQLAADFFMYAEDVQWGYHIHKLGYRILYYPEAVAIHHMGGSDDTIADAESKFYKVYSSKSFIKRYLIPLKFNFHVYSIT